MSMTPDQMMSQFQDDMVDDVLDDTYVLQLLNDAKDEVEAEQDWEKLKDELTISFTGGDHTTVATALPARFIMPLIMIEDDDTIYDKITFEDRYSRINRTEAYFLDMKNDNIHLCGENLAAKTLYFYHTAGTADMTAGGSAWAFPSRFHRILPYRMAMIYYAVDAGEKHRSWDDRWLVFHDQALAQMRQWDARLKIKGKRARLRNQNREDGLNLPVL